MNAVVNALYAEYLEHTGGDQAAAASLALAAVLQKGQPGPASGQPLTLPEVARHLRVRPNKVLGWVRSGELRGYDVTARQGGRRPKYRVNPEDLEAFIQRRAIMPPTPKGRPPGPRRRIPVISRPVLDTTKRGCGQ
jgi:hypothetical protein